MEITPKEHIEKIRRTKFSIGGEPNPLREDLHQATKSLSTELYAKDVHFLMELLQEQKMKPTKVSYPNTKQKMKFGKQELPVLTNEYLYPKRDNINDKFNCIIDNIWNIPKCTNNNESFVCSIKRGIICALYNFCIADNKGVPLLTKASPSGKGYTYFVLLTGPYKGIFTNFTDLCIAKEGIQNPRYKGFYSKEEADKALELDTTNMSRIKTALNPETVIINVGPSKPNPHKDYKETLSQNLISESELNLKRFLVIQKFLLKAHSINPPIPGLYIGVHTYFNQRFACLKKTPFCKSIKDNCPCKIKFLFRKAKIDLEFFKPINFENLSISIKTLLDFGCLESVLISPSERFDGFHPSINETINFVQATLMSHLAAKIVSCPSNFSMQSYPTHVIKLLPEDHKEYPCVLFNDGYEQWDVQGNTQYQYNLLRAQVQGYNWFFSDGDEREFNLIKETFDSKLYIPAYSGKWFIPFAMDSNNKLIQFFQKEKKDKEIYEASGSYGQQTPTIGHSLSKSSEIKDSSQEEEGSDQDIMLSKNKKIKNKKIKKS